MGAKQEIGAHLSETLPVCCVSAAERGNGLAEDLPSNIFHGIAAFPLRSHCHALCKNWHK